MILIVTPSLVPHDAVSNDVLQQRGHLTKAGESVAVYAEHCDPSLRNLIVSFQDIKRLVHIRECVLIYHHSVYWEQGAQLIETAKCRVFMKYHNITPPEFFSYDPLRKDITTRGRQQTQAFVSGGKFTGFVGDSRYNAQEILDCGADPAKVKVIAPFHCIHDFDGISTNPDLQKRLQIGAKNVLFVGRVAPNKGHKHLIKTLARYLDFYGPKIHLHIIGGILPGDTPYLKELESLIEETRTADFVFFHDKVNFQDLHTYYKEAQAFLMMSEHEGFCVPILEAQYHRLPLVALARGAVKETMGAEQIVFDDPDYDTFAVALHKVIVENDLRRSLQESGYQNFLKYEWKHILAKTLEVIHG